MARMVPKTSKRRLVFLTPIILVVVVYFLFTVGYYGYSLISLKNEQIKLSKDLITLQSEEEQLKNEIEKLKNPEYLARYAREKFLYSKDGEYIIKLEDPADTQIEDISFLQVLEENFIYIIIIFSIIIILFILLVFKNNKKKGNTR